MSLETPLVHTTILLHSAAGTQCTGQMQQSFNSEEQVQSTRKQQEPTARYISCLPASKQGRHTIPQVGLQTTLYLHNSLHGCITPRPGSRKDAHSACATGTQAAALKPGAFYPCMHPCRLKTRGMDRHIGDWDSHHWNQQAVHYLQSRLQ
jgi:hypothetical protein